MPFSQKEGRKKSIPNHPALNPFKDRYQKHNSDFPLGFYETPSVRLCTFVVRYRQ